MFGQVGERIIANHFLCGEEKLTMWRIRQIDAYHKLRGEGILVLPKRHFQGSMPKCSISIKIIFK